MRYIGSIGALAAAAFLALSPGMTYISRYFIHEIFFVFLSLTVVVSIVFFIEKRKAGPLAIFWITLLLFVAFFPSALTLSSALGGTDETAVWAFRIAFLLVESVLVYFVLKMLRDWDNGRPIYLLLASASVALLFATKETGFITLGTMAIACFCVWIWKGIADGGAFQRNKSKIIVGIAVGIAVIATIYRNSLVEAVKWFHEYFLGNGRVQEPFAFYSIATLIVLTLIVTVVYLIYDSIGNETSLDEDPQLTWSQFRAALGTRSGLTLTLVATATVFIYLSVLFFSSFFTYADGVGKAFEAYAIWTKTGNKDHTQNGWLGYIKWGMKVEAPLLLLSSLGAIIALLKAKHRFAMFTAFWGFGLFLAYTIIPYKTPWLALSFYLPMCIVAGYGINELISARKILLKASGVVLAALACVILAYQSYDINFVRYDDEEMGYVYAHSKREIISLADKIYYYADKSGKGKTASVQIVSPDYWPLTWYLNDYKNAVFHGVLTDVNAAEMIVAKKNDQDAEVLRRYSAHYKFVDVYPLRPGVDLVLLVRKDLADGEAQDMYKLIEYEDPK